MMVDNQTMLFSTRAIATAATTNHHSSGRDFHVALYRHSHADALSSASPFNFAMRGYSTTAISMADVSPSSSSNKYAVVDHSQAYETAMQGRHGQQIALARLEGLGKDDPPFDPFLEEEMQQLRGKKDNEGDEESGDDLEVAKTVGEEDEKEEEGDDQAYDEKEEELSPYNPDGSIRRTKSALATLRAGYPAGGLFAVIELAGAQHKVTTDDLIVVNKLKPVEVFKIGSVHTLKDVLLAGSSHITMVGMPYVHGAEVDVMVEEITQDAKVIVFKKRRRKNFQRKNGHRRDLTLMRVLEIRLPEEYKNHERVGRESVDELDAGGTVVHS
jgi:ribosomal protein L21